MAKVVIQLISDTGEVEDESTLATGITLEEAKSLFAQAVHDSGVGLRTTPRLVTEFHYTDGDVGSYDDNAVQNLWAQFTTGHEASHIVIRPDTEEGQLLSNRLHASAQMVLAVNAFVDTINATGGVVPDGSAFVPAGDEEWLDLGAAYILACASISQEPRIASPSPSI